MAPAVLHHQAGDRHKADCVPEKRTDKGGGLSVLKDRGGGLGSRDRNRVLCGVVDWSTTDNRWLIVR